jgi:hypothetical protein
MEQWLINDQQGKTEETWRNTCFSATSNYSNQNVFNTLIVRLHHTTTCQKYQGCLQVNAVAQKTHNCFTDYHRTTTNLHDIKAYYVLQKATP